jgi:CSLREA domain-containing protein
LALVAGSTACHGGPHRNFVVNRSTDGSDASPGDGVCTTTPGGDDCTLRAAIQEANASTGSTNSITIAFGTQPTLSIAGIDEDAAATGDLDVTRSLTIRGGGATVNGGGLDRVFHVLGGSLTIHQLTITGGALAPPSSFPTTDANSGGAIRNESGLVLYDSLLTGNRTTDDGGAIYNSGVAVMRRTTVSANSVGIECCDAVEPGQGGAIFNAAGAVLGVAQSTVTGNEAELYDDLSGGIYNEGTAIVRASTIWANHVDDGSTGAALINSGSGVLEVEGSLLGGGSPLCAGTMTSGGYNVVEDASCGLGDPTDVAAAPSLNGLAANGGPTPTLLPAGGSPGVDLIPAGTAGLCDASAPVDQRGVARPAGADCDAGSVEGAGAAATSLSMTVTSTLDARDSVPGDGVCASASAACTLRAAVDEANAHAGADTIVLAADPVLSLTPAREEGNRGGDLDVWTDLTIDGDGHTIDANFVDRVVHQHAGTLAIEDATLTQGSVPGFVASLSRDESTGRGAGILAVDDLQIERSTVSSSGPRSEGTISGDPYVGAGLWARGTTTIDASTFDGNVGNLGREISNHGTMTIVSSTINARFNSAFFTTHAILNDGTLTVTATTVRHSDGGTSAAVRTLAGSSTQLTATILSLEPIGGRACSGPVTSGGYNVAPDATCAFAGTGDIQSVNPLLGALAANGGPTQTRLPGAGSPAISRIPVGTAGLCDGTLAVDQRGVARPQGPACDSGSVEVP